MMLSAKFETTFPIEMQIACMRAVKVTAGRHNELFCLPSHSTPVRVLGLTFCRSAPAPFSLFGELELGFSFSFLEQQDNMFSSSD